MKRQPRSAHLALPRSPERRSLSRDDDTTESCEFIRRIDRYRLVQSLGKGGAGQVSVAVADGSSDLFVVKLLREELAENADLNARFRREAEIARLLRHPNIVPLVEARFERQPHYLVFPLIEGQSVRAIMNRAQSNERAIPIDIGVRIAIEVLAGLQHAHACCDSSGRRIGLVHRDLSPRNIMVAYSGAVSLIDFGAAHVHSNTPLTSSGCVFGTVRYMAPEQVMGSPIDQRTDIYALGAVLFEVISGAPMVRTSGRAEIMRAILMEPRPRLDAVVTGVPRALASCIDRCLSRDPRRRQANAAELIDELSSAMSLLPSLEEAGAFVSMLCAEEKAATSTLKELALILSRRDRGGDLPDVAGAVGSGSGLCSGAGGEDLRFKAPAGQR
jgi:serine/threonine-protein kinase